jgi:hypothetical protein
LLARLKAHLIPLSTAKHHPRRHKLPRSRRKRGRRTPSPTTHHPCLPRSPNPRSRQPSSSSKPPRRTPHMRKVVRGIESRLLWWWVGERRPRLLMLHLMMWSQTPKLRDMNRDRWRTRRHRRPWRGRQPSRIGEPLPRLRWLWHGGGFIVAACDEPTSVFGDAGESIARGEGVEDIVV